jgi:hypothetical protein
MNPHASWATLAARAASSESPNLRSIEVAIKKGAAMQGRYAEYHRLHKMRSADVLLGELHGETPVVPVQMTAAMGTRLMPTTNKTQANREDFLNESVFMGDASKV